MIQINSSCPSIALSPTVNTDGSLSTGLSPTQESPLIGLQRFGEGTYADLNSIAKAIMEQREIFKLSDATINYLEAIIELASDDSPLIVGEVRCSEMRGTLVKAIGVSTEGDFQPALRKVNSRQSEMLYTAASSARSNFGLAPRAFDLPYAHEISDLGVAHIGAVYTREGVIILGPRSKTLRDLFDQGSGELTPERLASSLEVANKAHQHWKSAAL